MVEEPGEEAGADHPCFVDDEHTPGGQPAVFGIVEVGEERRDRLATDPGAGFELRGGSRRERGADHPMPGALPRVAGRRGERLAGPRGGDHDLDACPLVVSCSTISTCSLESSGRRSKRPARFLVTAPGVVILSGGRPCRRDPFEGDEFGVEYRSSWAGPWLRRSLLPHRSDRGRTRNRVGRRWVGEGLVGELLDERDVAALGELLAPGAQHRASIERAGLLGESVGTEKAVGDQPGASSGQGRAADRPSTASSSSTSIRSRSPVRSTECASSEGWTS